MAEVLDLFGEKVYAVDGGDIPTIHVSGSVGDGVDGALLAQWAENVNREYGAGRIILDTRGGDLYSAVHFFDYVRANSLKVYVDGYGVIASAGTIIMAAAGRSRSRMAPNATYMIHSASSDDAALAARYTAQMADVYVGLTGLAKKKVLQMMKEETLMSAQEAVSNGFVGEVIELKRLAAKHNTEMSETKKTVRTVELNASQRLAALTTGKIEVDMDVDAELSEKVGELTEEVKSMTAKADEYKAESEGKDETITELTAKLEASEKEAQEKAEGLSASAEEVKTLQARVKELETTPLKKGPKGQGSEKVDPVAPTDPADDGTTVRGYKKLSDAEKMASIAAKLRPTKKTDEK